MIVPGVDILRRANYRSEPLPQFVLCFFSLGSMPNIMQTTEDDYGIFFTQKQLCDLRWNPFNSIVGNLDRRTCNPARLTVLSNRFGQTAEVFIMYVGQSLACMHAQGEID